MEKNIRNLRIGDVLKEYGYINEAQVEAALAYQKTHQNVRMGGALVELGYITEQQVMEALAQCLSLKLADVSGIEGNRGGETILVLWLKNMRCWQCSRPRMC